MKNEKLIPRLTIACVMLVAVVFCGCDRGKKHLPVIVSKSYETFGGSDLPKGLCRYFYREYESVVTYHEFTDSCGKYNIGDTLVGIKK